jgi:arabinan endo-1,5-alpha-L-arabinosidase
LFESVDSCCQGSNSTYKIMVGRSSSITGPYSDRDGVALLSGGGTLVLQGDERFRGPGHNAILHVGDDYYNVYHSYDADDGGVPTLRIAPLSFDSAGWPISLGP